MIKRYRILPQGHARAAPSVSSEVKYQVVPTGPPGSPPETLTVVIKAVDPSWGPSQETNATYARIEGYVLDDHGNGHQVLGFHLIGETTRDSIGLLEVHLDDA